MPAHPSGYGLADDGSSHENPDAPVDKVKTSSASYYVPPTIQQPDDFLQPSPIDMRLTQAPLTSQTKLKGQAGTSASEMGGSIAVLVLSVFTTIIGIFLTGHVFYVLGIFLQIPLAVMASIMSVTARTKLASGRLTTALVARIWAKRFLMIQIILFALVFFFSIMDFILTQADRPVNV